MANNQAKNILIAQRYARALAESAKDGKLTYEKISADIKTVLQVLKTSVDLQNFLINPIISAGDKKEIVAKIFDGSIDNLVLNFIKILIDKDRFSQFETIADVYDKILDKIHNISRIKIVSAVTLNEDTRKRLKDKLEKKLNKTVTFDWVIDPEIIAGLVIQMGDNIIDTSLKYKLEDLSKSIMR